MGAPPPTEATGPCQQSASTPAKTFANAVPRPGASLTSQDHRSSHHRRRRGLRRRSPAQGDPRDRQEGALRPAAPRRGGPRARLPRRPPAHQDPGQARPRHPGRRRTPTRSTSSARPTIAGAAPTRSPSVTRRTRTRLGRAEEVLNAAAGGAPARDHAPATRARLPRGDRRVPTGRFWAPNPPVPTIPGCSRPAAAKTNGPETRDEATDPGPVRGGGLEPPWLLTASTSTRAERAKDRELGRFVRQEAPAGDPERPIPCTAPGIGGGVLEPDRVARELRRAMGVWRVSWDPLALQRHRTALGDARDGRAGGRAVGPEPGQEWPQPGPTGIPTSANLRDPILPLPC